MKHEIDLNWKSGMAFESELGKHKIVIDASSEHGGSDLGPTPKPLMLISLAGCTAMDVISILKKMKIEPLTFNVKVEGELTEEHPVMYKSMKIVYEFSGEDLNRDKIEKAVNLSQDKYCGVSAFYKKAIPIDYEIVIL